MSKFIMMIGLPASGKSTYIEENYKDFTIISRDDLLMEMTKADSYDEAWQLGLKISKDIDKKLSEKLEDALEQEQNIVVDMTNLTEKARSKRLSVVPKGYKKVAVVVQTKIDNIMHRNKERSKNGKTIPQSALSSMIDRFQMPKKSEGFDEVIRVLN